MSLIIDIAFLFVALMTLVHYTKKGFIKTVFKFGNLVISVIVSALIGPSLAPWVSANYIAAPMHAAVVRALEGLVAFSGGSFHNAFASIMARLPMWLSNLIRSTDAEEAMAKLTESAMRNIDATATAVSSKAAFIVSAAISYAALFIGSYLLLKFLIVPLLDKLFDLPVLHWINSFLGFVVGALASFVNVMLIAYLVSFLSRFCSQDVSEFINNSVIINFITNLNIFFALN